MSTRTTIKSEHDETGLGFHIFTDWLDECVGVDVVHLCLEGVQFQASCTGGRLSVELTLPRAMAEKLGLLRPRPKPDAS
jgi:hypothetical protein